MTLTCRTRSGTYLPTEMALQAFETDGHVFVVALIRDRSEHRCRPPPAEAPDSRHSAVLECCGFRASSIDRDAFTPEAGYQPGLRADEIPLRDAIRFELSLDDHRDRRASLDTSDEDVGAGSS